MKNFFLALLLSSYSLVAAPLFGPTLSGTGSSSGGGGGSGSQTPLTNNVNGAGFTINNAIFSGEGSSLSNVSAVQLFRPNDSAWPLIYTNQGGQDDMLWIGVPPAQQVNTGDFNLIITSKTPHGSTYGGFFFDMGGTNAVFQGVGPQTTYGVLSDGSTNYSYDQKAGQIGCTPANTLDINKGCFGTFNNPSWPYVMGGFGADVVNSPIPGGKEYDALMIDWATETVHFQTINPTGGNGDPRVAGLGAWDTMCVDQKNAAVNMSNVFGYNISVGTNGGTGVFKVNNTRWNSTITGQVQKFDFSVGDPNSVITATNVRAGIADGNGFAMGSGLGYGMTYGSAQGGTLNLNWGGGTALKLFSTAGGSEDVVFQQDTRLAVGSANQGSLGSAAARAGQIYSVTNSALQSFAATITITNAPTFSHTNTAPVNAVTPVLWIDMTNAGNVYKMPLYQ